MDNNKLVALCTILLIGLVVLLAPPWSSAVGPVNALSVVRRDSVTGDARHQRYHSSLDDGEDDDEEEEEEDDGQGSWNEEDLQILRNHILKSLEIAQNSRVPKTEQSPEEMRDSHQVYQNSRGETERRPQHEVEEDPIPEDIIYTYHNQGMDPSVPVPPLGSNQTATWLYFSTEGLANVFNGRTSSVAVDGTLQLHCQADAEGATSQSSLPVVFSVYHVSADNRLALVDSKPRSATAQQGDAYLLDVTSSVREWLREPSHNFGLLLTCTHCDRLARSIVLTEPTSSSSSRSATITAPQLVVRTTRDSPRRRSERSVTLDDFSRLRSTGQIDCIRRKKSQGGANKTCCRKHLNVTFAELGLANEIEHPRWFSAYYCQGKCLHKHNLANTHAIIQSILRRSKSRRHKVPQLCCAPTKLKDLNVSKRTKNGSLETVVLKDAIVEECGCS